MHLTENKPMIIETISQFHMTQIARVKKGFNKTVDNRITLNNTQ